MFMERIKSYGRYRAADLFRRRLRCIFVLSTGRCGTKTLAHLLDLAPDIAAHHEPKPRFLKKTHQAYMQDRRADRYADSFTKRYLEARLYSHADEQHMRQALRRGILYAECSNRLTYVAGDLARFLPRSRFIFLHRDPAGTVRSGMRRAYYAGHVWDHARITPRPGTAGAQQWLRWDAFQRTCWYWNEVNMLALAFLKTLPPERIFTLPSADLFAARPETIDGLFRWCGVKPPDASRVNDVLSQSLNAQETGDFPKPDAWTPEQRAVFLEFTEPARAALGYAAPF